MKRKYAVFALIFAVSMLIGVQAVELADANPIPYPATPNTELPTLLIQTPETSSPLYANSSLELYFTVTQPSSWISYYMGFMPDVGDCHVYVYLDGYLKTGFPATHDIVNDYNVTFRNLTSAQHTVNIVAYAMTFSQIGFYQSNVTQSVSFIIDSSSQTIEFNESPVMTVRGQYPSTTSSPSPNPTLTPTPSVPEFSWLAILPLLVSLLSIAVIFKLGHRKKSIPI